MVYTMRVKLELYLKTYEHCSQLTVKDNSSGVSFIKQWVGSIPKVYVWTKAENGVRQKNTLIYKTVHIPASAWFSFINPKTNWNCSHVNQPHIPPSTHPHSTINGQCKAPHECWCTEMSLLIMWVHGNKWWQQSVVSPTLGYHLKWKFDRWPFLFI